MRQLLSSVRVDRAGLSVARSLERFVADEVLPGTGIPEQELWAGFEQIVREFNPRNRSLLEKRIHLQTRIDAWHMDRQGRGFTPAEYRDFLEHIGYLVPEGAEFSISTANVDREISTIAGPQLVVPVSNARFALNAANARWGSLFDALYGTDMLPEEPGRERGTSYNPARGELVIARATQELDRILPLSGASHQEVTKYLVEPLPNGHRCLARCADRTAPFDPSTSFLGFARNMSGENSVLLFEHHGLRVEIHIDHSHPVGSAHPAGVKDVMLEAAITTIQDCEDSVAAVDCEDKVAVYRNWLGLMKGDLVSEFVKNGTVLRRALAADRVYKNASGGTDLALSGRSLMLVRNVGLLMTSDAIRAADGSEIYEGIMDAVLTTACALHDMRRNGAARNSSSRSVYIVKPKLHGPEEVQFTCDLFGRVEALLCLGPNTIKIGVMDEERRTTANLVECIRVARERIVFINTGFLDRTGDDIRTSTACGPVVPKDAMKGQPWMTAYECANVNAGLATGFQGRAQIGKGMWSKPDEMREMFNTKISHLEEGASTAWVPSPTAATLHALHYHQIDVSRVQARLRVRERASLNDILSSSPLAAGSLSHKELQEELDNNIQGILGYVVRWIDQGIGCSKVPDIRGVGLMEDRATCRISSQHVGNWMRHGVVSEAAVEKTLERMAQIVDGQNADDPNYRPMCPDFGNSLAYQAARELVFEGENQPNGYTEPILHRFRRKAKARKMSDRQVDY